MFYSMILGLKKKNASIHVTKAVLRVLNSLSSKENNISTKAKYL